MGTEEMGIEDWIAMADIIWLILAYEIAFESTCCISR